METLSIAILLAIGAYFLYMKITTPPRDISDLEKVIAEVDVLIYYGKNNEAIELLEEAKATHGNNANIISKLNELHNDNS